MVIYRYTPSLRGRGGWGVRSSAMTTGVIKLQRINIGKLRCARELRREMTEAEAILWKRLRGNQLGIKFRRQQLIAGFVADFFGEQAGLVIEVDGGIHTTKEQATKDALRRKVFEARGLTEIRFTNEQLFDNTDTVIEEIRKYIRP